MTDEKVNLAYRIALLCKQAANGAVCRDDDRTVLTNEVEYLLHASDALIRECLSEMAEVQVTNVIEKLKAEGLIREEE